jgi:hypothetical protein
LQKAGDVSPLDRHSATRPAQIAALAMRATLYQPAYPKKTGSVQRVPLFAAAGQTLAAFARTRLSATLGATLVLHTWTRKLEFHPHVHAIVTAGGLTFDGARLSRAHRSFLLPVKAMSQVFRAKMLSALRRLYRDGRFAKFRDFQDPEGFARLARAVAKVDWYLYAKPTFKRGGHVLDYLGRYTHRVGLANSRLLRVSDTAVTFRTKGDATCTLDPVTFLHRFVQHVLPIGFQDPPPRALCKSSAARAGLCSARHAHRAAPTKTMGGAAESAHRPRRHAMPYLRRHGRPRAARARASGSLGERRMTSREFHHSYLVLAERHCAPARRRVAHGPTQSRSTAARRRWSAVSLAATPRCSLQRATKSP